MKVSLRQLGHIAAVNQHRNYRRAADAINLSQPALSRSVSAAEHALGVKIFDRTAEGLVLTHAGEVVLRRGQEILQSVAGLEQDVQLLQGLAAGTCKIVLGVYPSALSGGPAVARLSGKYPQLRLQVRTIGWRDVPQELLDQNADVGLCEISTLTDDHRFVTEPLASHKLVFYCRAGHPLASLRRLRAKDIDRYPLAMIRLPPRVSSVFPGQGVLDPVSGDLIPTIEVNDLESARSIVMLSDSVGMAAPYQIADHLRSGDIVALPFRPGWLKLDYGFVYLKGRTLVPSAYAFMEEVRAVEVELAAKIADWSRGAPDA